MFDTVILLTGPAEQFALAALLRSHNPHLTVQVVASSAEIEAIEPALLRRARLVAFTTPVIVPPKVLDALGYGAYNFHPGSPDYPGWAPAHFAIYDGASLFGATAHAMVERVDDGPIVGVEWLSVPTEVTVHSLECLAYTALARLYWVLAKELATQSAPLSDLGIRWSPRKSSRRSYAALCDISPDISREELDRRVGAFGGNDFGVSPTIRLHGHTFRLVTREADDGAAPPRCDALVTPSRNNQIALEGVG